MFCVRFSSVALDCKVALLTLQKCDRVHQQTMCLRQKLYFTWMSNGQRLPGGPLDPGFIVRPLAWMISTSSCPFLSARPISTSPEINKKSRNLGCFLYLSFLIKYAMCQISDIFRCFFSAFFLKHSFSSPIEVVARVCRPTNWAGPMPSKKSLNWASEARHTPE